MSDDDSEDFSEPKAFFGSNQWREASAWLGQRLACDSLTDVTVFRERKFCDQAPTLAELVHLKAVIAALYEQAIGGTAQHWDRVRLAHSALDPKALDVVADLLDDKARQGALEAGPEPQDPTGAHITTPPDNFMQQKAPSPVVPPAPAPVDAPSPLGPSPWQGVPSERTHGGGIDVTAYISPLEFEELETAVPFTGSRVSAPEPPQKEEAPHEDVGQTAAVDLAKIASTRTTAGSEKPEGEPPIPVERYAMVVACTEDADDARRAQVHAQVGVGSEEDRRKLDQEYGRFLRSSPELKLEFIRDLKRWKDWLEGQRTPK